MLQYLLFDTIGNLALGACTITESMDKLKINPNARLTRKKKKKKSDKTTTEIAIVNNNNAIEEIDEQPVPIIGKVVDVYDQEIARNFISDSEMNKLLNKYKGQKKIIATAILWLCDKISDQQVAMILRSASVNNEQLQQNYLNMNSICNFFAGKTYTDNDVEIPEFNVDSKVLSTIVRELIHTDLLQDKLDIISSISDKTKEYYKQKNAGQVPVMFDNAKLSGKDCTVQNDTYINRIEGFIGDIIKDYNHYIAPSTAFQGFFDVFLTDNYGNQGYLIIDPGFMFGDYRAVIPSVYTQFPVFVKNKEAIKEFITHNKYLDEDEMLKIKIEESQFNKLVLYERFNVSKVQDVINKMSRNSINCLEAKLIFIDKYIEQKMGYPVIFRLDHLKDSDNFMLISDDDAIRPCLDTNAKIKPGLSIKVNKISYTITDLDPATNNPIVTKEKFNQDFVDLMNSMSASVDDIALIQRLNDINEKLQIQ